ncbi:MAG: 50S ribosomal protein L18 [bacterium]
MDIKNKNNKRINRAKRVRQRIKQGDKFYRVIVFRSNKFIYAQIIDKATGNILCSANDMKDEKGKKAERAKNVGLKIADLALKNNIKSVIFDRKSYLYHGRVKALADGAREGGLEF